MHRKIRQEILLGFVHVLSCVRTLRMLTVAKRTKLTLSTGLNINIGWTFASDDAKVNAVLLDTLEKIEVLTKARNLYDPFIFLNDALSTQSVLRSYGDANFEKLQTVSHIYDPTAMFQYQVPGGFKLV